MRGVIIVAMRITIAVAAALAITAGLGAQETKPVPKDSVRLAIPGCTKGYVFTAGPRTADEPGSFEIREGMHLRMNGPKKLMSEIKAREGQAIEITGLMKKGQYKEGIDVGHGIRVSPGSSPTGGGLQATMSPTMMSIDVEGWRPIQGYCKTR